MHRRTWLLFWVLITLVGGASHAAAVGGEQVPDRVRVAGRTLTLNGTAVQGKLWVDVLGVALYLEDPAKTPADALQPGEAKQLRLLVLRSIDHERLGNTLYEGFRLTLSHDELAALKPRILRLIDGIWALRKGQHLAINWIPGRGIVVEDPQGVRVRVPGDDFARAAFGVWLGPNAPAPELREGLLRGP